MAAGEVDVKITNSREFINATIKSPDFCRVMINFDDSPDSTYLIAYPILSTNQQTASLFPRLDWLNDSGQMTDANLISLYEAGWDIGNHGHNHSSSWTNKSIKDMEIDVNYADIYLKQYFPRSAKFVAYPYGNYNQTIIDYIKTKGCKMARTTVAGIHDDHITLNGDNEFKIKSYSVEYTDAAATVTGWIDAAIAVGGLCVLLFHRIVAADAISGQYLTADFQTISDYIKTKQTAGDLQCVTFSQYYQDYIENDLQDIVASQRVGASDKWMIAKGKDNQVITVNIAGS